MQIKKKTELRRTGTFKPQIKLSSLLVIGSGQSKGDNLTSDFTDTCYH
jgi:hypothetical protein